VAGVDGRPADQRVERYEREPLDNLATVTSGDLIEVELIVESRNDYEYLIFEDKKAAGFEPVEVRSGYFPNDLGAYMELRDERVSFFVRSLPRGRHSLRYRLRAEIPGRFSALPAVAWGMYAPELQGNSDEMKLSVEDETSRSLSISIGFNSRPTASPTPPFPRASPNGD
jgi:alpha-2-macroglobulin